VLPAQLVVKQRELATTPCITCGSHEQWAFLGLDKGYKHLNDNQILKMEAKKELWILRSSRLTQNRRMLKQLAQKQQASRKQNNAQRKRDLLRKHVITAAASAKVTRMLALDGTSDTSTRNTRAKY
jgi:hypothetical protein